MKILLLLLTIKLALSIPLNPQCGVCNQQFCPILNHDNGTTLCDHGTMKDTCNCCDVCLRKERESCGGIMSMEGACDQGLFCHVRHPMSKKNLFLPEDQKIGKCESDLCKQTKCLLHQWCKLEDGKPLCHCPYNCENKNEMLICGFNGKQYKNHCELKKEECETQIIIDFLPGKCQECVDTDGTKYQEGTKLPTENACEFRMCRDGSFFTTTDTDCISENGLCSNQYNNCPIGKFCLLPEDDTKMGACKDLDPELCYFDNRVFRQNETFITTDCTASCKCDGFNAIGCVSLCPPQQAQCGPEQSLIESPQERSQKPRCHCMVPRCIDNNEVCKREHYSGPCYGYFRRWYHDSKDGSCKRFIYGGCHNNGNNFETKELCERACIKTPDPVVISGAEKDVPALLKPFVWPFGSERPQLELSKTVMTIEGNVIFDKEMPLPEPSCLVVSLKENSKMDVRSVNLESVEINLSYHHTKISVPYRLDTLKPVTKELGKRYSLQAKAYVGRCPKTPSSIRKGDFINMQSHDISLTEADNLYVKDIKLKCYKCQKRIERDQPKMDGAVKPLVPAYSSGSAEPQVDEEPDFEGSFPFSGGPRKGPELSDKKIMIKGKIQLPHKHNGNLPNKSCLHVAFKDISVADASSVTLADTTFDVSGLEIGSNYNFELESKKPVDKDLSLSYSVSAVLNYGWCPNVNDEDWVHKGDYLTDTTHPVNLEKDVDEYVMDVNVICYSCPEDRGTNIDREDEITVVQPANPPVVAFGEGITPTGGEGEGGDPQTTDLGTDGSEGTTLAGGEGTTEDNGNGFFPFGTAPAPKLSTQTMSVKGYIKFPSRVGMLPTPSCLYVRLIEITAQDVAANIISKVKIDVSESNVDQQFAYVIDSLKPQTDELWKTYALEAVLNRGWCPNNKTGSEWLRDGDYFVDTIQTVDLNDETDVYEKDIEVVINAVPDETSVIISPEEEASTENNGPKLGNTFMEIEGNLLFQKPKDVLLVDGSCLRLLFQDTTGADGKAIIIKERIIPLSSQKIGKAMDYMLGFNKPEETEFDRSYEITAVLNIGWCINREDDIDEWIRPGDYHSDIANQVFLTKDENKYTMDIVMTLYSLNCMESNTTYVHGEEWNENDDPCVFCSCHHGESRCLIADCAFCKNPADEPGVCCPKCLDEEDVVVPLTPITMKGCIDSNRTYAHGESWDRDPCTSCECENGDVICIDPIDCLPCNKPVYEPGLCCPRCLDDVMNDEVLIAKPSNTVTTTTTTTTTPGAPQPKTCYDDVLNKTFTAGESWNRDDCSPCMCEEYSDRPICAVIDCVYTMIKPCNNLTYTPGKCCPDCGDEPITCYEPETTKTYEDGESWIQNTCLQCSCVEGDIRCENECAAPIEIPKSCTDKSLNKTFENGDSWNPDSCTSCQCEDGRQSCASQACNAFLPCKNPIQEPGKCCKECPVEQCVDRSTNKTYNDGDQWVENDGCAHCQCISGSPYCASPMCAIPDCGEFDVITVKGICCPICSNLKICTDVITERKIVEGGTWQDDDCQLCKCTNEGVVCKETNKNIEGCSNVVSINRYCGEICLDKPEIDEIDP